LIAKDKNNIFSIALARMGNLKLDIVLKGNLLAVSYRFSVGKQEKKLPDPG